MDLTPEYVKMCEKAREIQKRPIRNYNVIHFHLDGRYYTGWDDCIYLSKEYGRPSDDDIWLPRQDQLQEMVVQIGFMNRMDRFMRWVKSTNLSPITTTGEQCWLHYVMAVNFNKSWTGSDWE